MELEKEYLTKQAFKALNEGRINMYQLIDYIYSIGV